MAVNLIVSATVQKKEYFTANNPIIDIYSFAINSEGYEDAITTGVKLGDGRTRWNDLEYLQNIMQDTVAEWLRFQSETTNSRLVTLPDMRVAYVNIAALSDEELNNIIKNTATIQDIQNTNKQQDSFVAAVQEDLDAYKESTTKLVNSKVNTADYNATTKKLNDSLILKATQESVDAINSSKYDQSAGEALDERLTTAEEKIKNFSPGGSIDLSTAILTGGNSTTN